jgi:hypothetical protein
MGIEATMVGIKTSKLAQISDVFAKLLIVCRSSYG